METITVEQLSPLIHKAVQSIYNDLKRNPQSLPPVVRLPGSRRVLFANVTQWLASHVQQRLDHAEHDQVEAPRRRPGRPRKTQ